MSQVKIATDPVAGKVTVAAPFNHAFIDRARWLEGEWSALERRWIFPIPKEVEVRKLCASVYQIPGPTEPTRMSGARRAVLEARIATLRSELARAEAELKESP
jgi:hypothetical protein